MYINVLLMLMTEVQVDKNSITIFAISDREKCPDRVGRPTVGQYQNEKNVVARNYCDYEAITY